MFVALVQCWCSEMPKVVGGGERRVSQQQYTLLYYLRQDREQSTIIVTHEPSCSQMEICSNNGAELDKKNFPIGWQGIFHQTQWT